MPSEAGSDLERLIGEKCRLEILAEEIRDKVAKKMTEIEIADIMTFHRGVQVYRVWGHDAFNISLLVEKNRLGGCGILLWGVQFSNKCNTLAIKINEFEAQFTVLDGQPGSHDFAMLSNASQDEGQKKLFENLHRICSNEGINYVFLRNGGVLSDTTKICPGKEFRDISDLYMMIARKDGSVIPEFEFINPQTSSVFWSNG